MMEIHELEESEKNWWYETIKKFRKNYIEDSLFYISKYTRNNDLELPDIRNNLSNYIFNTREGCWKLYLKDESIFFRETISFLVQNRELPKKLMEDSIIENISAGLSNMDRESQFRELSKTVGSFASKIMPYIYTLCLSATQSRRSRAGKTFENIIEYLLKTFDFSFDNQASIGKHFYKVQNIGKIVDIIIPGKEEYVSNRSKCQIISMKTTLRERWQEVVEEMTRTNIPHIFLLTVDKSITPGILDTLGHHNITIVDYKEIANGFNTNNNIISFERFFREEIPDTLGYWERRNV